MKPTTPYIKVNGTDIPLAPEALKQRRFMLRDAGCTEQCEGCSEPIHETASVQIRAYQPPRIICECEATYQIY